MELNRKYNGETKLIIGCGQMNKKYHEHLDCYTIDCRMRMNPSLVCNFGTYEMKKYIPDNSFNEVIFEGLFPNAIISDIGLSEFIRICKKNAKISVTMLENGKDNILAEDVLSKDLLKQLINMTLESYKKIENDVKASTKIL
jgi:hypothetical protein